ncbi:MAG: MerR family transcriptional regulator [Methylocystis sp.]|nr:MerR family transcriptional regulator [Methylocystis sp.]
MAAREDISTMRPIGEVAESLGLPQHVLRFWETRFKQINPFKRAGGRRLYRPRDIELVSAIRHLLYSEGYTIRGVQRILKEQGVDAVIADVNRRINREPPPDDIVAREPTPEEPTPREPTRKEPTIDIPRPAVDRGVEARAPRDAAEPETPAPSPLDIVPPVFIDRNVSGSDAAAPRPLSEEEIGLLRDALAEIDECRRLLKLMRP